MEDAFRERSRRLVEELEALDRSPLLVALRRRESLENDGAGLAAPLVSILQHATDRALQMLQSRSPRHLCCVSESEEIRWLRRLLELLLCLSSVDSCLEEELGCQGSHVQLAKLLRVDCTCLLTVGHDAVDGGARERDQDTLVELQDVAGKIASLRGGPHFPLPVFPFSREELKQRLPLVFIIDPVGSGCRSARCGILPDHFQAQTVLINQVSTRQSAQCDVGFVAWPSAVALAHWVVSNPAFVAQSAQVLEIGAGCGLVSIVAALIRKRHAAHEVSAGLHHQSAAVTVTDFNPVVLRNLESNVALNDVCEHCQVMGLDFNQQTLLGSASGWVDTESQLHPPVDLILAADIICQPEDAYGVALLIRQSLRSGGQAVVVCADSGARFGVDHFAPACQKQGLRVSVTANEDLWSEQLAKNVELTSGYVPGMKMNTFRIHL